MLVPLHVTQGGLPSVMDYLREHGITMRPSSPTQFTSCWVELTEGRFWQVTSSGPPAIDLDPAEWSRG